jgi:hypothetical protein
MPFKKHKPEEIIGKQREAEILLAQAASTAAPCRRFAVSEQPYYLIPVFPKAMHSNAPPTVGGLRRWRRRRPRWLLTWQISLAHAMFVVPAHRVMDNITPIVAPCETGSRSPQGLNCRTFIARPCTCNGALVRTSEGWPASGGHAHMR